MYPTSELPNSGPFVASQVESLRRAGVAVDVVHLRRYQGRNVYRGLGKRIERLAAERGVDLVHVMYGGVMADIVTRAVRACPVVVSFCGSDLLGGRRHRLVDALAVRISMLASRRAARRADGVIVKSRNLFEALPPEVKPSRTWIVPNGVDFDRFRPMDRAASQRRLGWEPGLTHILFPAPRSRPEKRYTLAEASVQRLTRSGARVELHALESIPHEDVPLWLNAANAVLLTSIHEGSPNAVKEALACNVPVVSVDVGDVKERLTGIDGCFLAEASPEDIADKLGRAISRPGRIDARNAIANLALDRTAAKICQIYAFLARRPQSSRAQAP